VRKNEPETNKSVAKANSGYKVSIADRDYSVVLEENKAVVNGRTYEYAITEHDGISAVIPSSGQQRVEVNAPMPGAVIKINFSVGDHVTPDDTMFIIEAMKMETEIKAPSAGKIAKVLINPGVQVAAGQVLAHIS
jgi:pyruvate carboxylase subunit B